MSVHGDGESWLPPFFFFFLSFLIFFFLIFLHFSLLSLHFLKIVEGGVNLGIETSYLQDYIPQGPKS